MIRPVHATLWSLMSLFELLQGPAAGVIFLYFFAGPMGFQLPLASSRRPVSAISVEQYERLSLDLIDAQNKGRFDAAAEDRLLKRHRVSRKEYETAISAYGQTDQIRKAWQPYQLYKGDIPRHVREEQMKRRVIHKPVR